MMPDPIKAPSCPLCGCGNGGRGCSHHPHCTGAGPTKGLSCTQPWAQLVVERHKRFETRSWETGHRGLIAIHATKDFPRSCQALLEDGGPIADTLNRAPGELKRGAIIGVATIMLCLPVSVALRMDPSETELAFGDWSEGRYIWQLGSQILLPRPIPAKGARKLWTLPPDIQGQLNQQLETLHAL